MSFTIGPYYGRISRGKVEDVKGFDPSRTAYALTDEYGKVSDWLIDHGVFHGLSLNMGDIQEVSLFFKDQNDLVEFKMAFGGVYTEDD